MFYRAKKNPRHAERAGQRLLAPPRRRLLHIVRGDFQNHRLLILRRLLFAKGHAPFACSVVNASRRLSVATNLLREKRRREQGLAQRSKKSRKSGSPKIFSGTARGVAKQLRALLLLPRKRHLRKQVPFSVKSTHFRWFLTVPRLYNKGRRLKRDNQSKNCPVPLIVL